MREQLADGYSILVAAAKGRDVVHDRVVEPDLLFVVEDHNGRRGADDLAERGDVVDGALGVYRCTSFAPGESAESLLENRRPLSTDYDRGAGVASGFDSALDDALARSKPAAGHANVCR